MYWNNQVVPVCYSKSSKSLLPGRRQVSEFLQNVVKRLTARMASRGVVEQNRHFETIVRPFLSQIIWAEVLNLSQQEGQALPTEIHQVSVLYLDVVGFTDLTEKFPLSQVAATLNTYLADITPLIYHYEGDIHKYLGDGFLSVFTSADAAVQAGRAIQQATAAFNTRQTAQDALPFSIRIGIDSGMVMAISLGCVERQDRTLLGSPVNLADRLQAKATPGRIWLSQATYGRLADRTGLRCLGPVALKGSCEQVLVYEI